MARSLVRLMVILAGGSFLVFALRPFLNFAQSDKSSAGSREAIFILLACLVAIATQAFHYALTRYIPYLDRDSEIQAHFLDAFNSKYADVAILGSAALSLFLELSIIRWQSSVLPFIALYKNFTLLACFIGLGVGYALAGRDRIPLLLVLPLLAWQFGFLTFVRYGLGIDLKIIPFREQQAMGIRANNAEQTILLYGLLALIFLLTALTFIPVGQLCGRLMEHRSKLRAYGLNLLGSLLGVLLMLAASLLWTPPLVWFGLCFIAVLLFTIRKTASMVAGFCFAMLCTTILSWPVDPATARIYSPYQLLEIGSAPVTGLPLISAAGNYYQRIFDFSGPQNTIWSRVRAYYEFPYKTHPQLGNVAIVGAGTGNDVAAALRSGAQHVEAIEIDPAIQMVGKLDHPEKPYSNPRVHTSINDARSFVRSTDQSFDMIVYGLLDSHTLLSQGSSVRIDSFVYTLEGLREARGRLKPGGVLSLSFSVLSDNLGRKIYLMLQQAFDGRPPICVEAGYDESIIFLESNDPNWTVSQNLIKESGFKEKTNFYANPSLHADLSTDDWPFFYMPQRIYPMSYLVMVFQVLALSLLFTANFLPERPRFTHLSFFFLGAGFMLIETKGITEMGLTFGNTWQLIGIVIAGILIMAFLGNCAVHWFGLRSLLVPYLLLFATLALGWYLSGSGGFASTYLGRFETAVVLTLPMLFSGIVFST
ncbi:MAG TPA: hypothetical protein VHZ28_13345, partial [Terracidiphilus sp.]|nr:hypothetical protein [Terracidiphilus sp.]